MSRRPYWTLFFLTVFTAIMALYVTDLEVDSDAGSFSPDNAVLKALDTVRTEFSAGDPEQLMQIIVSRPAGGDVTTPDALAALEKFEQELDRLDRSGEIALEPDSFVTYMRPVESEPGGPVDEAAIDSSIAGVLDSPVGDQFSRLFSSDLEHDGESVTVSAGLAILRFAPDVTDDNRPAMVDLIVEAAHAHSSDNLDLLPFGDELLANEINELSQNEVPRLMGIGIVLLTIILLISYRSITDTIVGLIGVAISSIWMMGIAVILGPANFGIIGAFTPFTLNAPLVLLGLAIDYAIQLTTRYREETGAGRYPRPAANVAIATVGAALVLTSLTTMAGFLSNLSSPIPPIRDFGIILSAGAFSAFVVMAALVPACRQIRDRWRLRRGKGPHLRRSGTQMGGRAVARVARAAATHAWPVTIASVVVGLLGFAAATQIGARFAREDFVPADSEGRLALEVLIEDFGGDLAEQTYLVTDGRDPAAVAEFAERAAGVADVRSVSEPMTSTGARPVTLVELATTAGADRVADLRAALNDLADQVGVDGTVTSSRIVEREINERLTSSGKIAIAVAMFVALIIMVTYNTIFGRRPFVGVLTVASAGVVVATTLGAMWVFDVAFNIATVTIASIAIGIGIDYSIHMTHRFVEELGDGHDVAGAVEVAGETTGGALLSSTLTTVAAFGVLAFSSLLPFAQFGLVTAIAIALSFVGSIVVQPAFLGLWDRYR